MSGGVRDLRRVLRLLEYKEVCECYVGDIQREDASHVSLETQDDHEQTLFLQNDVIWQDEQGSEPKALHELVSSCSWKNGYAKTPEGELKRRERISVANSGRQPWNLGVSRGWKTKSKIRASLKKTYSESPELCEKIKQRQLGKQHTPETREKIRMARLNQLQKKSKQTQQRKTVQDIWNRVLCIQERRETLYALYRSRTEAKKKKRKKEKIVQMKKKAKVSTPKARKARSPEHRQKISESMKKKWQMKSYRESVQKGLAASTAFSARLKTGNSQELVQRAEIERKIMQKKQEKLRERAAELLAMAHDAAEQLKDMEYHKELPTSEGSDDSSSPTAQVVDNEIEKALRSLDNADALVARLKKRQSI